MTYIIDKLNGHHEPQEEKVFYEVMQRITRSENNLIIELGAYWSYYSMWFVKEASGRAVIVEPNIKKLEAGLANFRLNNLACTALNGFVGRSYGKESVFVDWNSAKSVIPCYSVDYLMKHLGVSGRLTILHSDTQGAEYDMLLGAGESLKARNIDYIFISTHVHKHKSCLNILTRYGYHIIASHGIKESASADGLIVASSPRIEKFNVEITKN